MASKKMIETKDDEALTDEEMLAVAARPKEEEALSDEEMLSAAKGPAPKTPGPGMTALGTLEDVVTLGHAPNLVAGIEEMSFSSPEYIEKRDRYRKELQLGQEENPISSIAGTVAGIGGQIVSNPGGMLGKALGKTPMGKAAIESLANLGLFALQNPGDEAGKAGDLQADERAEMLKAPIAQDIPGLSSIPMSSLAALPLAGPLISQGGAKLTAKAFGPTAKELRKQIPRTEAGGRTAGAMPGSVLAGGSEAAPRAGGITEEALGAYAQQSGIAPAMSSAKQLYTKASSKVNEIGQKIGNFIKDQDVKLEDWFNKLPPGALKQQKLKQFLETGFTVDGSKSRVLNAISKTDPNRQAIENLVSEYFDGVIRPALGNAKTADFENLHRMRAEVQDMINYAREGKIPAAEKTYNAILKEIDRAMDAELDFISQVPGVAKDQLKRLRKEYSLVKTLENRALRQYAKEEAKPFTFSVPTAATAGLIGMISSPDPRIGAGMAAIGGLAGGTVRGGPKLYSTLGAAASGQAGRMTSAPSFLGISSTPEKMIEGFPMSALVPADPHPIFKMEEREIIRKSEMPPSQKARMMNLLEKGYLYRP